jgi:hypothetical protein
MWEDESAWQNWGGEDWSDWDTFDWSQFEDPYAGYDWSSMYNIQPLDYGSYGSYPGMEDYQSFDPLALQAADTSLPDYWGSGVPDSPSYGYGSDPLEGWGGGESTWAESQMSGGGAFNPTYGGNFSGVQAPSPFFTGDTPIVARSRFAPGNDGLTPGVGQGPQSWLSQLLSPQGINALTGAGGAVAGGLSRLFADDPKARPLTPEERAEHEARLAQIRAQTERTLNPVFPPRGGGGGGGFAPPSPGGAPNVAAFNKASGLDANAQRFDTLYQQILKETADLPKPDEAQIAQRSQALVAEQTREIEARYAPAKQQILERANRFGENPAGQLAQLEEQKQRELQGLLVKARTQVLAEGQAQQAVLLGRITPAMQLLASVNPAAYSDVLARVFGTPTPGSTPEFREPTQQPATVFGLSEGLK